MAMQSNSPALVCSAARAAGEVTLSLQSASLLDGVTVQQQSSQGTALQWLHSQTESKCCRGTWGSQDSQRHPQPQAGSGGSQRDAGAGGRADAHCGGPRRPSNPLRSAGSAVLVPGRSVAWNFLSRFILLGPWCLHQANARGFVATVACCLTGSWAAAKDHATVAAAQRHIQRRGASRLAARPAGVRHERHRTGGARHACLFTPAHE
jgi:hypothetical protein